MSATDRKCLPNPRITWVDPATIEPWAQRAPKLGAGNTKWAPVFGGLAVLLYRGGPLYELTAGKLWIRPTAADQPVVAGASPEEAHEWCTANVTGYPEARAEWEAASPKRATATTVTRKPAASKPKVARSADQAKRAPVPAEPQVTASSTVEDARELPQWAREYLARLVYEAKRDYAAQYIAHVLGVADAPEHPGAEWADKVHARVERLASAS